MPITRRRLLTACGAAGASLLLPAAPALAAPRGAAPDDWLGWFRAHPRDVAVVLDDGRGGRVAHRPHEPQPLASAVKVVHLAGYELAGLDPEERVRVGDWERYYLPLDGGAHPAALAELGIPATNGMTADDPNHEVRLDDLVAAMIRHSDNAAADYLRHRLGEAPLRAAAARCGWPDAPAPWILGDMLRLVLGRPVSVERYVRDPQLQLEVIGRFPDIPATYQGQVPWARTTWRGTAAGLHKTHRAIAGGRFPRARAHLEAGRQLPDGVAGIGLKGGSLAGVLTLGCAVRWADGRVGSAAVLVQEVDEERFAAVGELFDLVLRALLEQAALREFQVVLS
ncbi:serine hydrolase [Saccharothrix coeruleofusca]|uniref:Beta-lactamase n=1 Tax=Saccharothrix coeruleofusca TaxID=33919 RepID=A0A918AIH8_9PSEU|nr:serine hydrolase [Saccharothrix coeruleofusca]GGP41612.1 hypothetical protein GCM10010185_11060 [Saccharothrix coeruleofusca]